MTRHNVLILGDARMAFPVMKAMAKSGHRVHAGVSIYSNYMEWSRYLHKAFWHAPLEPGTDEPWPRIRDWLITNPQIDTIQPVNEASIRFVTRHRDFFEERATLILPDREIIALSSDKTAMFDLCRSIGGPVAPYRAVASVNDIHDAVGDIGYPFILKPSKVDAYVFNRKALILNSPKELTRLFPHWPGEHPELLMQRYVSGARHSVIFSSDRGRLLGAVQIKAGRTHEEDGTGYTTYGVTVESHPVLRENVERFVAAMNYSYTGCLQYIIQPDTDEVTFMELNPRVSLARLAEAAGLPHSLWALALAHGRPIEGFADPWSLPKDVQYVWTKGELGLIAELYRSNEIGATETFRRLLRAGWEGLQSHHAIFDWQDPLPAIGVYANWLIRPMIDRTRQRSGFMPKHPA